MSKNPYEIRLELLRMAQDIVSNKRDDEMNVMWQAIDEASEKGRADAAEKYSPKEVTPKELIKLAKELNEFIDNK